MKRIFDIFIRLLWPKRWLRSKVKKAIKLKENVPSFQDVRIKGKRYYLMQISPELKKLIKEDEYE